jgi:hypothetical protein
MDVKKNNYDPEGGKFQYWVGFKTDAGDDDVQARIAVEVALSVSENGDLADLSFTVPKACRNDHAMTFLQKQENSNYVESRIFLAVPGRNGDSVLRAPADLQLDRNGRIIAMEIH